MYLFSLQPQPKNLIGLICFCVVTPIYIQSIRLSTMWRTLSALLARMQSLSALVSIIAVQTVAQCCAKAKRKIKSLLHS